MDGDGEYPAYELYQQGLDQLDDGQTGLARESLEAADGLEPGTSSIQEALGRVYFRLRRYEQAASVFAEILQREPLDHYAHFCIARCYDRLDDVQRALHHYRLATTLQPSRSVYRRTLTSFMHKQQVTDDGPA